MNRKIVVWSLTIILLLILAACGGQAEPAANAAVGETAVIAVESAEMPAADSSDDEMMSGDTAGAADMAAEPQEDAGMAEEPHAEGDMAGTAEAGGEMESNEGADMDSAQSADASGSDGEDMAEAPAAEMDNMAARPAWQSLVLANAATGEEFTLGGFAGKTVFVEPMATWCSNCRQQLNNVSQARAALGEEVVFVALSLETTLDPAQLAAYQNDNGFDWTFAVMSDEILQGLAAEFGRSITSAPSTPHFIIRPDGTFTELSTGIDAPDQLVALLQAAGS